MADHISFSIRKHRFDECYRPHSQTRETTNFANLARGKQRQQNLRNAFKMVNNRFNSLVHWDNKTGDRYAVDLDIVSVDLLINERDVSFPSIEVLQTTIVDKVTGESFEGVLGNNFSSYVRDYDFSVVLAKHNEGKQKFSIPSDFGVLHGNLFKQFVTSPEYRSAFTKKPVICLSVSDNKVYNRTENVHPILGVEYQPNESSLTESYFKKMDLKVRYFMPPHSVAPLAFYYMDDLLNGYSNIELASTISTMETFQKIYRPEIYNANAVAGKCYKPNLKNNDYSETKIVYDREERSQLAIKQGQFVQEHFIKPYQSFLKQISA